MKHTVVCVNSNRKYNKRENMSVSGDSGVGRMLYVCLSVSFVATLNNEILDITSPIARINAGIVRFCKQAI